MASSQALPEPMNSSPHHSKVKVTITLPDPTFVAGAHVSGKVEVECRADRGLGIGIMMIELFAIQELSSRDHSATSTFLHSRRLFQGPGLPPSNAVQAHPMPGDPPLPQHYHQARKGRSTFLFRIPIPASSPSSIAFGSGLAKVNYELRASVGVYWKNEKRLVIDKRPIDVVEAYPYDDVFMGKVPEAVVVGENGKLWMQGKLVGSVILAGDSACLELQVKNHSNKKNSGLTLSLIRTLYLPASSIGQRQAPVQISDTLTTVPYRGPEYIIPPGAEGVANLVFDVPKHARGAKGGTLDGEEAEDGSGPRHTESLFEVKCKVEVKLAMGMGSKDIVLEIPVDIVHPNAAPAQPPIPGPYGQPYTPQEPVLNPAPYAEYNPYYPMHPMSPAPPPPQPHHIPYVDPVQNQVWMPPPPPQLIPMPQVPQGYPHYPHPPVPPEGYHSPYAEQQPYHEHYLSPYPQQNLFAAAPESIPHIPRPSSVGPVVSASQVPQPIIAGLPPPPAATSLLPLHALHQPHPHPQPVVPVAAAETFEAELGKGDRALRISQHLRISSRNRSVSPQSHRYPLPGPLGSIAESSNLDTSDVIGASLGPPSNAAGHDHDQQRYTRSLPPPPLLLNAGNNNTNINNISASSPLSADGMVHSPRPQLTPKHSFTRDPVLGGMGTAKSERVEELEKMADEVAKASRDLSHDLPKGISDILAPPKEKPLQEIGLKSNINVNVNVLQNGGNVNKTLPGPPVPSGKKIISPPSRARADLYFAEQNESIPETLPLPSDQTPPTPALLAVHPSSSRHIRQSRSDLRTENGLDALERRLLAEVGTRKMDTRHRGGGGVTKKDQKRPDVRDILSVSASVSASAEEGGGGDGGRLSATNTGTGTRTSSVSIPGKSPETLHDSAISSLTLAGGLGGDDSDPEFDGRTHRAGVKSRAGSSDEREGLSGGGGGGLHLHMRERERDRGQVQVSTPTKTLNLDRVRSGQRDQDSREDVDSGKSREGGKSSSSGKKKDRSSKSAAKGRVAAWLGGIDPDVPPQEQIIPPSPSVCQTPASPFNVEQDTPAEREGLPVAETQTETHPANSAPPNPRSSGFVPIATLKKDTLPTRPLIAKDATVVEEARRVQDIWAAEDTPIISAKEMPRFFKARPPAAGPMSIHTNRRVSPPSAKPPPPDPRSKPLSYSAVAKNVWKLPPETSARTPITPSSLPPVTPPKTPISPPPKKVLQTQGAGVAAFPPPRVIDPEVKYDIRSARGGRGGKVTAVANLWASGAINSELGQGKGKGVSRPIADSNSNSNVSAVPAQQPQPQPPVPRAGKKLFSDAVLTPAAVPPQRTSQASGNVVHNNNQNSGSRPTDATKRPDARSAFFSDTKPAQSSSNTLVADAKLKPASNSNSNAINPVPKKVQSATPLVPPITKFAVGGGGKGSKSTEALVQKRPATAMSAPYSLRPHGKTTPTLNSLSTSSSGDPRLHLNFVAKGGGGANGGGAKPVFKGTSDPAVAVIHAVPTLSSTASLARPQSSSSASASSAPKQKNLFSSSSSSSRPAVKLPLNLVPTTVSSGLAERERPASPSKPVVDLAFGQARIRDLIKKYQGGQVQKT